jgi:hypothetical protein
MKFEIDFNKSDFHDDYFLIDLLGAYWVKTGSGKYPPFETLEIEVRDFEHLEDILREVDNKYETMSSAIISFDRPTIFIEL